MRFLFGILVGVALTIGGVWIVDHRRVGDLDGPLVNWDQVDRSWKGVRDVARFQLRRIMG